MDWSCLVLTPRSDGEDPDIITRAIKGALKYPEAEVFVPAAVTQIGEDRVVQYLMVGYAFVRNPGPRLKNLEGSRYVQGVLGSVTDQHIERMRVQIQREMDQGIGVGDTVKIVSGPYRHLTATVIEEIPEDGMVQVFVKLRSKQSIVTLPRSFLEVVDRTPLSGLFSRLSAIRVWVRRAKPILAWSGAYPSFLMNTTRKFILLSGFSARNTEPMLRYLYGTLRNPEADVAALRFDVGAANRPALLRKQYERTRNLSDWAQRAHTGWNFVWFMGGQKARKRSLDAIQTKLIELYWFEDVLERVGQLEVTLEQVAHKLARRRKSGGAKVIQNILVDGHNLAFRCMYAPGMASLSDGSGRPTGVILGFLRSLGALKKRFPEARLYVTWDGSSNRRKAVYADYKGNRPDRSNGEQTFDQIGFLRDILPKFGAWQVFNPDEEADDVIATVVKGSLREQHNVIYSTDKDMLALVTGTTFVLMPGAGSRKEVLYDTAGVESAFGVAPGNLLQLRAFCGDPSDNIPGVPRVPKKVLKSLVRAHGTIDGVYKSSLTGLSDGQYERLRLSEPQVRLNLQLMSFVDVPVTSVDPDPDPEGAARRLQNVGINPAPILKQFEGG